MQAGIERIRDAGGGEYFVTLSGVVFNTEEAAQSYVRNDKGVSKDQASGKWMAADGRKFEKFGEAFTYANSTRGPAPVIDSSPRDAMGEDLRPAAGAPGVPQRPAPTQGPSRQPPAAPSAPVAIAPAGPPLMSYSETYARYQGGLTNGGHPELVTVESPEPSAGELTAEQAYAFYESQMARGRERSPFAVRDRAAPAARTEAAADGGLDVAGAYANYNAMMARGAEGTR